MTLPVAVLAGGLGTRLRGVTGAALPKVLVPVAGRPFVDHKLEELAAGGITRVVFLLGHGAEQVRAYVGDGARSGLEITCIDDGDEPLGTGGALRRALPELGDAFWVTYGDTLLSFDLAAAEAQFVAQGLAVLMTVLHNEDAVEPSNALVIDDRVVAYAKSPPPPGATHIDYGMLAFRRRAFDTMVDATTFDLAALVSDLAAAGEVGAFEVTEPFREIGTPESLRATEDHRRTRDA